MKYCNAASPHEIQYRNTEAHNIIAQWNVNVETSGSYQFETVCQDETTTTSSSSTRPFSPALELWIDDSHVFSFHNSCQKWCVSLSNTSTYVIRLTTQTTNAAISRDPESLGLYCLDVRLAFPNYNGCPQTLLLKPGQCLSENHDFAPSPSQRYSLHFRSDTGDLVLQDWQQHQQGDSSSSSSSRIVWKAAWNQAAKNDPSCSSYFQLAMQGDGNLLLRQLYNDKGDKKPNTVWKTVTQGNPGAYLVLNDAGQVLVIDPHTAHGCCSPLYVDGLPPSSLHYDYMRQHVQRTTITIDFSSCRDNIRLRLPRLAQSQL
jgi:hypothetical protein